MNAQMQAEQIRSKANDGNPTALPTYQKILLAIDSSDHANRSLLDAITIANPWRSEITAAHVYAAKLHDVRFRQMEGGLPEQFREENELERQRDVHDDLITRGLSIITDSYLDHSERLCQQAKLSFKRCSLEGKNYRELTRQTNSGEHDLLILGALGLGAVQNSRIGTVCQRVIRRSQIDSLVIKQPDRSICDGPIVIAIDGSSRAYGGLLTGLSLAQQWQVPIKIIAAFDPYFHYVAFNRIADILSEEAGKVFRFQEQEKLHEEIIDSGLAKIYQGHLDVAQSIADDFGFSKMEIETKLLDGKPHDAIEKYLKEVNPSLLVIGKTGIHADAGLDIGGTSENLLHNTECALLLSQTEFTPRIDLVAETTTSWTTQAKERMNHVPEFVRGMARMAILRYAQEKGHTVITERIVEDATAQLCPGHAKQAMTEIVAAYDGAKPQESVIKPIPWSNQATAILLNVDDLPVRGNLMMRAEKKARQESCSEVSVEHVTAFIEMPPAKLQQTATKEELHWQASALARLARVPEGFMRDTCRQRVEDYAHEQGIDEITLTIADTVLAQASNMMSQNSDSKCPFGHSPAQNSEIIWTDAAQARMQKVPAGFMRDLTRQRIETFAQGQGKTTITPELIEKKYLDWGEGSAKQQRLLSWNNDALQRIERIPNFVRGMVIKEVERCAHQQGETTVTPNILSQAMSSWEGMGKFHSQSNPELYKS